jgi:hypothetical protein
VPNWGEWAWSILRSIAARVLAATPVLVIADGARACAPRPAASSAKPTRSTSAGSQRCDRPVGITSAAARRRYRQPQALGEPIDFGLRAAYPAAQHRLHPYQHRVAGRLPPVSL